MPSVVIAFTRFHRKLIAERADRSEQRAKAGGQLNRRVPAQTAVSILYEPREEFFAVGA